LTYTVGRVLYGLGYPDKRSAGFGISFLTLIGLIGVAGFYGFTGVYKKYF